MKINGIDISRYEARQMTVDFESAEIEPKSQWIEGAVMPLLNRPCVSSKKLSVTLAVHSDSRGREGIINNCSKITELCLGNEVTIELDGFDHRFVGWLSGTPKRKERSMHRWHLLTLVFDCYERGKTIKEASHTVGVTRSEIVINNPGTAPSPIILKVKPGTNMYDLTVNGLCVDKVTGEDKPVRIKNIVKGKNITIDGSTGLFTEDGVLKDMDIYCVPFVRKGKTTISVPSVHVDLEAEVIPIYL